MKQRTIERQREGNLLQIDEISGSGLGEEQSCSMIFQQDPSKGKTLSDSESDFEDGDNQKEMTELDLIDKSKLEHMI